MHPERKTIDETWLELQNLGFEPPRTDDGIPFVSDGPLNHDSDVPCLSFFRTILDGHNFEKFSMPRTFIGRSDVRNMAFASADLSGSLLCWNDFTHCDFTGAELRDADLRASIFKHCSFRLCDLRGADLRRSDFIDCDFSGAIVSSVRLASPSLLAGLKQHRPKLDQLQLAQIDWQNSEGEEPPGG